MFRVAQGTLASGATGTADFTVTGFGTCKGALVFVNRSNTTNNPETGTGTSWHSSGFFDGTTQVCYAHHTEDGNTSPGSTDCWNMYSNNKVAMWCNNAGTIQFAATATTITNGIRITTDTSDGSAHHCVVVLIPDTGVANIKAQVVDCSGISAGKVEVTNNGFQPDMVFVLAGRGTANETVEVDFLHNFGVAVRDGSDTNMCMSIVEDDGRDLSAQTTYLSNISSDQMCAIVNSNGGLVWSMQLGSFDASGWTSSKWDVYVNPVDPTNQLNDTDDYLALAIQFTGAPNFDLTQYTAPTATGSWAQTAPGFQPTFGLVFGTEGVVDNTSGDDTNAESFIILPFDSTTQWSLGHCSADNVSTVTTSTYSLTGWRMVEDNGVPGTNDTFQATFTSFDANGFTWNFSAVPGSSDLWPILTIGPAINPVTIEVPLGPLR